MASLDNKKSTSETLALADKHISKMVDYEKNVQKPERERIERWTAPTLDRVTISEIRNAFSCCH